MKNLQQKIINVIIAIVFICVGIVALLNRGIGYPEGYEKEFEEKKAWITEQGNDISLFMDNKINANFFNGRGLSYKMTYKDSSFNIEKLQALQTYLISKEGWVLLNKSSYSEDFIKYTTNFASSHIINSAHVLCKDKATIIMFMSDVSDEYQTASGDKKGTYIYLKYDFNSPCYQNSY